MRLRKLEENKLQTFFSREKRALLSFGSVFIGCGLLTTHYMFWGSLSFFDAFPSHESTALILIFGGLGGYSSMFNFRYDDWTMNKNKDKVVGKILNKIVSMIQKK